MRQQAAPLVINYTVIMVVIVAVIMAVIPQLARMMAMIHPLDGVGPAAAAEQLEEGKRCRGEMPS